MKDKEPRAVIVKCECGYESLRWNDNRDCKKCGGKMEIILEEVEW